MEPNQLHKSVLTVLLICICSLGPVSINAQWLDFSDETSTRLVVTSVANSDDEEKDIAVGDLDNDGRDDVIVCRKEPFSISTEGAKSDLLLMNENGVLVDRTTQYVPEFISNVTFARDVYIGDFDGDGWKDVIIGNTFGQQPQYYSNQGEDGSGNWLGLVDESASRFPILTDDTPLICAVWGGDIDGDLDQDIYLVNYKVNGGGGTALDYLLINNGNGVFTNESQSRLGDLRNSAFGTAAQIVDIDNDGDQDVLKVTTLYGVQPWGGNGLIVMFNNGGGTFTNWQNLAPGSPYMFEVADYNNDGFLDAFVVDDGQDYLITVNSVIPDVSLNITTTNVVNGAGGFGGNVHAIDLDLDGDLDIAVSDVDVDIPPCNSGRKLAILENQNGVFVDNYSSGNYDWAANSYDLGFIDINGDGLQDFITGGCAGYGVFMSDNCDLVTSSADFDLDGLPDACDPCPTNPDPNCEPDIEFPVVGLDGSAARQWNDMLLESIRKDFARPTVHARNLFHTSIGMWDAWAAYSETDCTYLLGQTVDGYQCAFSPIPTPGDLEAARSEAISYMAYRLLSHRFANSPSASLLQMGYDNHMSLLGYDINVVTQSYGGGNPAALGNYLAQCIINFGLQDGSNEQNAYTNLSYTPVNDPMIVDVPGNDGLNDWNRWQPLTLDLFIDQSGNEIPGSTPEFLSPEWGQVSAFALDEADKTTYNRDGFDYEVYHDPGNPPLIDTTGIQNSDDYKWGFSTTLIWSSHLDATDGVMWDISPASIGKRDILPATVADYPSFYDQLNGGTTSPGHVMNPFTGQPYAVNNVPRADYARVLAEFWADGPESETPPGHWFTLMNYVSDHPLLEKRFMGVGPILSDLEWDVKGYLMLGGAMHDAAVSAWGMKGWYDYLRPISAIRAMTGKGQSTDPGGLSYHPAGIPLVPGQVEVIQNGDPLAGAGNVNVGDIKIKAWRGHNAINNVDVDEAGVGWIYASEWEPYQRPSFVTPPFAGYISGHSTFSRAAAEILTSLTGDSYFPGGIGTFTALQDDFLVFEDGPSVDVELQWATYQDAADESGLSRIWGGIHPPADDIPGRKIGIDIGQDAFAKALTYFGGSCSVSEPCDAFLTAPVDLTKSFDPVGGLQDRVQVKWFKASPQIRYSDADAAMCDIKFWAKRDLDPCDGSVVGPVISNPDTVLLADVKKTYGDNSPREIFKWPVKFRANGANNTKRAEANIRYEWQVRCECGHDGTGPESPWSSNKTFNTPDFDITTGIYTAPASTIYLPDVVDNGPALVLPDCATVPVGYTAAADQACAQTVIDGDPTCLQDSWDAACQSAYDDCVNPPTCTDGTQNGDETGIDCGGSFCLPCAGTCPGDSLIYVPNTVGGGPALIQCSSDPDPAGYSAAGDQVCAQTIIDGDPFCIEDTWDQICQDAYDACLTTSTCVDGIQNGNETGVDCGGPDCPACPTCVDGIQNGNETGIDCGGPDCPACPTCSDGVQNGDELGIDCGGAFCPPCGGCPGGDMIYIPDAVGGGPALIECSSDPDPTGYSTAGDQVCAQFVIDNDAYCIDTNWDNICQTAYDNCVNPPIANDDGTVQTKVLSSENVDFSIYPNPNGGERLTVIIRTDKASERRADVRLYDITGKLLTTEQVTMTDRNSRIDLNFHPKLGAGIYMIEFIMGEESYRERVLVQ